MAPGRYYPTAGGLPRGWDVRDPQPDTTGKPDCVGINTSWRISGTGGSVEVTQEAMRSPRLRQAVNVAIASTLGLMVAYVGFFIAAL